MAGGLGLASMEEEEQTRPIKELVYVMLQDAKQPLSATSGTSITHW